MLSSFKSSLSGVALLALISGPAAADTIASEVWAEWQQQAELSGQTLTAEALETDTGLRLLNLTTTIEEEGFVGTGTLGEVQMVENADGTLSVTFSDTYEMNFSIQFDPGEEPGNIQMFMEHENLLMQVSGDAGARLYEYSADQVTIRDGALSGGGSQPPEVDLDMLISDLAVTYRLFGTAPDDLRFSSSSTVGSVALALEVSGPPEDPGRVKVGVVATGLQGTSAGSILPMGDTAFPVNLPENFEIGGSFSHSGADMEMSFNIEGDEFDAVYSVETGETSFTLSDEQMGIAFAGTGLAMQMAGSEIPIPLSMSAGATGVDLNIPLAAAETPQNVDLRVGYENLSMAETMWGMFDPSAAIPRDPATLIFDATAQVQLFVDLIGLDPNTLSAPPGELRGLTVNELRIAVGGAELSGDAGLSFAPGQVVPVPEGTAELQLTGGNALLDALIGAGLIPAEQGAFVRGMANVFGRPGAAPDTLESTIAFGADGSITANGVPLQ